MNDKRSSTQKVGGTMFASEELERDAERREALAMRLMWEAMNQGQRALSGLFAAPASVALGIAASVTYTAAILERSVEILQLSFDNAARGLSRSAQNDWREESLLRPPDGTSVEPAEQARS